MKFDTVWPADSVEFCPHPSAQRIFVCGTYKLEQSTEVGALDTCTGDDPVAKKSKSQTRRIGKCLTFELTEENGSDFNLLDEICMPAILDMKWSHARPRLAIAEAEGHILTYDWDFENKRLNKVQQTECRASDILCLSLDWSNRRYTNDPSSIVVSSSDGFLTLLGSSDERGHTVLASWYAHDFEPWIAAWDYWDTNVIFSGGDDLKMKSWDIRMETRSPVMINKCFTGGITSIQSNPHTENILAVGSYDGYVRIFDTRKLSSPVWDIDVGGGVWRLKWHPSSSRKHDLLAACMHNGFKILSLPETISETSGTNACGERGQEGSRDASKTYDEHGSLAYGADWSGRSDPSDGSTLIASCSFYDHSLHTWRG